ncbi:MAG: MGMT family protein [Acidobacteriota bacterium]
MAGARRRSSGSGRVHGEVQGKGTSAFAAVYELVRAIPPGRVMTYGQISSLLGSRLSPVAVGWALHGCPEDVPWHRVVNASGGFSTDRMPELPVGLQKALLAAEGVTFSADGTVDLNRCRWLLPSAHPPPQATD